MTGEMGGLAMGEDSISELCFREAIKLAHCILGFRDFDSN